MDLNQNYNWDELKSEFNSLTEQQSEMMVSEIIRWQFNNFDAKTFNSDKNALIHFVLNNPFDNNKIDEIRVLYGLFILKYQWLGLIGDFLEKDSKIKSIISFKFISINELSAAIKKIQALDMIEYDFNYFAQLCANHIKNRFLEEVLPEVNEIITIAARKRSNRVKGLKSNPKLNIDTIQIQRFIEYLSSKNIDTENNERVSPFNPKSVIRKSTNPQKNKFYQYELMELIQNSASSIPKVKKNDNFKMGEFCEAQVDLIRILEPSFTINTFEYLFKRKDKTYIYDEVQYRSKYLNKRVKSFGLFNFERKINN